MAQKAKLDGDKPQKEPTAKLNPRACSHQCEPKRQACEGKEDGHHDDIRAVACVEEVALVHELFQALVVCLSQSFASDHVQICYHVSFSNLTDVKDLYYYRG